MISSGISIKIPSKRKSKPGYVDKTSELIFLKKNNKKPHVICGFLFYDDTKQNYRNPKRACLRTAIVNSGVV